MVGKSLIFLDKIFNVHSFRKNVDRTDIVQCQTLTSQSSSRLSSKFLQAWQVRARKFFSRVQRNCQKCGLAVTAKAQIFGMLNSQYLLFFSALALHITFKQVQFLSPIILQLVAVNIKVCEMPVGHFFHSLIY